MERKSVRFAEGQLKHQQQQQPKNRGKADDDDDDSSVDDDTRVDHDDDEDEEVKVGAAGRLKKRKRIRNDDEMDDIDDWRPEDDMEVQKHSEHELLQAKRKRRTQREQPDGKTLEDDHDDDDDDDEAPSQQSLNTKIDSRTSLAAEGFEIEPFHMNDERTDGSGYFDGDTYVFRQRSTDEEPDAWLESLANENSADVPGSDDRQSSMMMQRIEQRRAEAAQKEQDNLDEWTEQDLYSKLLPHLVGPPINETVLQAVQRFGALMKHNKSHKAVKTGRTTDHNSNNNSNKNNNWDDAVARQLAKDCLDDVTEAANALLLKGNIDIYQSRQSDVQEALRKLQEQQHQKALQVEDAVGTVSSIPKVLWEYRGSQDHHIHGPYSSQEMLNWIQAGYFVGPSAVQVRSVQQPLLQLKSTQDDLLSDLLDDDVDVDENGGAGEKQKEEDALIVRGEWQMSDKVDFARHVAT